MRRRPPGPASSASALVHEQRRRGVGGGRRVAQVPAEARAALDLLAPDQRRRLGEPGEPAPERRRPRAPRRPERPHRSRCRPRWRAPRSARGCASGPPARRAVGAPLRSCARRSVPPASRRAAAPCFASVATASSTRRGASKLCPSASLIGPPRAEEGNGARSRRAPARATGPARSRRRSRRRSAGRAARRSPGSARRASFTTPRTSRAASATRSAPPSEHAEPARNHDLDHAAGPVLRSPSARCAG